MFYVMQTWLYKIFSFIEKIYSLLSLLVSLISQCEIHIYDSMILFHKLIKSLC